MLGLHNLCQLKNETKILSNEILTFVYFFCQMFPFSVQYFQSNDFKIQISKHTCCHVIIFWRKTNSFLNVARHVKRHYYAELLLTFTKLPNRPQYVTRITDIFVKMEQQTTRDYM